MKCPVCGNTHILFLSMWYQNVGEMYVLMSWYGCESCRVMFTRPVSEDAYYYVKESDKSIVMRPTHVPAKSERRIHVVDVDPGFVVRGS